MGAYDYKDLMRHYGHKVKVVYYGEKKDPANVAIECESCHEVLLDFDKEGQSVDRKFYKTVITFEVLSENEPVPSSMNLDEIYREAMNGDWSGRVTQHTSEQLNAQQAAEALVEQGTDPSFFGLTAEGEEVEE